MGTTLRRNDVGIFWIGIALLIVSVAIPAAATAQSGPVDPPAADAAASAAAATVKPTEAFFTEPELLSRAMQTATRFMGEGQDGPIKTGFYPRFGDVVTGAGWLSLGPGYRYAFGDHALVDASAAISWRAYKTMQARFELSNLARNQFTVGWQAMWRDFTQVTYYGDGPASLEANESAYRVKATDFVQYVTYRPAELLAVTARLGWLGRPMVSSPTGPFDRGFPDTRQVFADDPVYALDEQPRYVHGDVSVTADTRDHRGYPTSGGVYRAAWAGYSDRDAGRFSFHRYEIEGAHFLQIGGGHGVIAMHGWTVLSHTGDDQMVPFYLAPSLGGNNTLRGYANYRFHDRNLLLVNLESRWAIFQHVDAAVFADAGNVAAKAGDLDLAKRNYGVGLRLHSNRATFVRFDVAHGADGFRFMLNLSDPLRLSRIKRHTTLMPFAP
jgi:surface antigen Omp85-like protein